MTDHPVSAGELICNAACYHIRVCGRLTQEWSDRLQGMRMAAVEEPGYGTVTELSGVLADQAALMGVLTYLYDCGIALISVRHDRFE